MKSDTGHDASRWERQNMTEQEKRDDFRVTTRRSENKVMVTARQHEFPVGWPGSELGPCPGEYMLGALAGCTSGVAQIVAAQMKFDLSDITLDVSGFGPSSQKVTVRAMLKTTEGDERIQKLRDTTERACPVFQFFKLTNIPMDIVWQRVD